MKLPSRFHLHVHAFNACWLYTDEYFITLILYMPSGTRIPKPKTKKLGHKITSLYRSTKFTQLHDVGIIEIISSGEGAFHSQCEVFPRRRKLQKNTNNIIQMRSKQIAGMRVCACISYLIRLLLMSADVAQCILPEGIVVRCPYHPNITYEHRCEKTGLRGFRPGPT